ncbi:MAG: undecaprenyl-diphosphatase UppP [Capsulimonadaceae bacterium]|nr:undecaprenyl-diphosphatase UppP [Capsulimonadaceae bacterium]
MHVVPHISYMTAVILGLLQGLTEFLPVSSTAHMAIVPQLFFKMDDPGSAFSAVVQLGPIIAIIAYFRNDLVRYVEGIIRTKSPANVVADDMDARLGWYTLFGTIPLLIFGAVLEKKIDTQFRHLDVIAVALILLALVLWAAEAASKRVKTIDRISFKDSQIIGWAQVLALVPGASRSGVTITAGLFLGLTREAAARFSFLLSIPAITAAGVYKLLKTLHTSHLGGDTGPFLLGALVAGLFAYVVVKWFMGFMKEHNTGLFIAYRIALGITILVLLHLGVVKNSSKPVEANAPATATVPVRALVATPDGHYVSTDQSR